MVAPNLLLTARHCISVYTDGDNDYSCTQDGDLINSGNEAGVMGPLYEPEEVAVHTGADPGDVPAARGMEIVGLSADSICRNDLAFVVLDTDLEVPIVPLRLDTPIVPGERVTAIGYGINEIRLVYRFRRDGVRVLEVGRSELWPDGGDAPPRSFVVGQAVCEGDSGGPTLTEAGAIAGVYSFYKGTDCTNEDVRNFYFHLAPFGSLIERAFEAAGAEPRLEAQVGAGGAGGAMPTMQAGTAGDATGAASNQSKSSGSRCSLSTTQAATRTGLASWLLLAAAALARRRQRFNPRRR
jgi:hypothetical protein